MSKKSKTKKSEAKKALLSRGSTNIMPRFTGERMIPELNKGAAFFYEHLARYFFSSQFVRNKIVLDAGCGVGYGAYILSKYGKAKKVYAVDISQEAIEYARFKYQDKAVEFRIDNVEKLSTLKDNFVDVAVSFEVIEHLKNQNEFLKQIKRVLKKDGIFILSTPNKYTYPEGNPFHVKELYPEEFRNLLKSYFKNIKFYHQSFEFSQVIKPEKKSENIVLEEGFVVYKQKLLTHPLDERKSQYIIAICSNNKLPIPELLAINSPKVDNFDLTKGFFSLGKQFGDLHHQINDLNAQLSQKIEENRRLNKQLDEVMGLIEIVKKEIERKNKEISTLKSELKRIRDKEKEEGKRLMEENKNLQEQINQTRVHIQNLEATVDRIKSAKFFKLWQGYCKIMKVLRLKRKD